MSKLSNIYAAYNAEMKSVLQMSNLLLQKETNSLNGELKTSGKFCEDFVKNLIRAHVPNHIRVTSGYIIDPEKKNNDENLPQFDLLLVDNSIPPIYKFQNVDIEVVPVESICGVIEIKRNINKKNIDGFAQKLSDSVLRYKGLTKDLPYQANTINIANFGPRIAAPLIGIISLTSDLDQTLQLKTKNIIDFIWSIDGFIVLPYIHKITNGNIQFHLANILNRPKNESFSNINQEEWKSYLNDGNDYIFEHRTTWNKESPEQIITLAIGWLTAIFYGLSGRFGIDRSSLINDYYFS